MCTFDITIPEEMKQPIFVYYQIDNFFQNLRRYLKSKSIYQLQNHEKYSEAKAREDCYPIVTIADMEDVFTHAQK